MSFMRPDEYEYKVVDDKTFREHLEGGIGIKMFKVIPEGNRIDPYIVGELYYVFKGKRFMVELGVNLTEILINTIEATVTRNVHENQKENGIENKV